MRQLEGLHESQKPYRQPIKAQELNNKEAQTLGGEVARLNRALIELDLTNYFLDWFATENQQRVTGEAETDGFP
ncbi:hypothetical protein INT43_003614 [Umbelopsis isabellina]|uniref:Uncharacterized protein n=1 Tax=Mortierella isabellina TaxID=91625 RepID=A0A8H7PTI6_MORIS|nr:hypothetical protein INT43_003614 [Umbelopsis isabellina]